MESNTIAPELCLNCNYSAAGPYCANCGQKKSTHRYSMKHFVEHDFVHGIWHVDRGLIYTIKELFTRPGHSVREYIEGRRANFFNFVTLILLIMGVTSILGQYSHIRLTDLMPEASREAMGPFERFVAKYPKVMLLITIPINSLFSLAYFRKARLNYSEHLVLNSYKAAVELMFGVAFLVLTIFYTNTAVLMLIYYVVMVISTTVYGIWFYYQFFSKYEYSKKALLFRSILVPVSYLMLSVLFGILWAIIMKVAGK